MKYDIVACLTPTNKKEFRIGEKATDGQNECDCSKDRSSGEIKLKCGSVCKLENGTNLPLNDNTWIGNIQYQCQKQGNITKLIGVGNH